MMDRLIGLVMICAAALFPLRVMGQPHQQIGVTAAYNITMPGDWTSTSDKPIMGSGAGLGLAYTVDFKSRITLCANLTFNYNDFKLPTKESEDRKAVSRLEFDLPVRAGYEFALFDDLKIAPLIGCGMSVAVSNHCNDRELKRALTNPNYYWGFGVELRRPNCSIETFVRLGINRMVGAGYSEIARRCFENSASVALKYYFKTM